MLLLQGLVNLEAYINSRDQVFHLHLQYIFSLLWEAMQSLCQLSCSIFQLRLLALRTLSLGSAPPSLDLNVVTCGTRWLGSDLIDPGQLPFSQSQSHNIEDCVPQLLYWLPLLGFQAFSFFSSAPFSVSLTSFLCGDMEPLHLLLFYLIRPKNKRELCYRNDLGLRISWRCVESWIIDRENNNIACGLCRHLRAKPQNAMCSYFRSHLRSNSFMRTFPETSVHLILCTLSLFAGVLFRCVLFEILIPKLDPQWKTSKLYLYFYSIKEYQFLSMTCFVLGGKKGQIALQNSDL